MHCQIIQVGPAWQKAQVNWMSVLSDLTSSKEWAQLPVTAMMACWGSVDLGGRTLVSQDRMSLFWVSVSVWSDLSP